MDTNLLYNSKNVTKKYLGIKRIENFSNNSKSILHKVIMQIHKEFTNFFLHEIAVSSIISDTVFFC